MYPILLCEIGTDGCITSRNANDIMESFFSPRARTRIVLFETNYGKQCCKNVTKNDHKLVNTILSLIELPTFTVK